MTLQEKINQDIKEAMLAKQVDKLAALRSAKAAIMLEATKDGVSEVPDSVSLTLITKLVKQRKDSADIYSKQGRQDLVNDELNQMKYLEAYLPEQMNKEDIRKFVIEVISQQEASSLSDIGRCMGVLISKLKGRADGKIISEILREELIK
tara:strand:- start:379 stop:828 length:450 start_codon:yes stop_codon:yes gene_type:complete